MRFENTIMLTILSRFFFNYLVLTSYFSNLSCVLNDKLLQSQLIGRAQGVNSVSYTCKIRIFARSAILAIFFSYRCFLKIQSSKASSVIGCIY